MAAVLVGFCIIISPEGYVFENSKSAMMISSIELIIGLIIGSVTFSGSIVAFLKLHGLIGSKPLKYKFQHSYNLILLILIVMIFYFFL